MHVEWLPKSICVDTHSSLVLIAQAVFLLERGYTHRHTYTHKLTDDIDHTHGSATTGVVITPVDFEMASCYSSHSEKFPIDWLIDWLTSQKVYTGQLFPCNICLTVNERWMLEEYVKVINSNTTLHSGWLWPPTFGVRGVWTHTQPFYCWSGICPGPPGSAGTRKVKPRRLKPIWIYSLVKIAQKMAEPKTNCNRNQT